MMLDAVCLSEEELSVLFGPASHGACHSMLRSGKKPSRVSTAPGKRTQQRKKKTGTSATHAVVPARCGYRTGKCQNLQAVKRNGKLHKLCEFHRERANLNQKKLDRKKRMQRSKRSTPSSAESEDDAQVLRADRSPRHVEASVTSGVFVKAEQELAMEELFLPTSLDEAPLVLGCEELAIFCSLMTVDVTYRSVDPPSAHTASCHYYTSIV